MTPTALARARECVDDDGRGAALSRDDDDDGEDVDATQDVSCGARGASARRRSFARECDSRRHGWSRRTVVVGARIPPERIHAVDHVHRARVGRERGVAIEFIARHAHSVDARLYVDAEELPEVHARVWRDSRRYASRGVRRDI